MVEFGGGVPAGGPESPRYVVEAGRYWAGAAAAAVVAALVALVGWLVFDRILGIDLVVPGVSGRNGDAVRLVLIAVVACLLAAALLHVLVLTTPRPRAFFGWIVALATVVAALLPFVRSNDRAEAAASAAVYVVIGIAIGSLLGGVAGRTVRTVGAPVRYEPPPAV